MFLFRGISLDLQIFKTKEKEKRKTHSYVI